MKKFIISAFAVAAMLLGSPVALAQTHAAQTDGTSAEMPWFVSMGYGGFDFEIPAGSIVEKGSTVMVKYPDGTFGLSMVNEETQGANQKIAFELCRHVVKQLDIKDAHVDKRTIGGVDGAIARGSIENRQVTVIILPVGTNDAVTTVIMASPERANWVNNFIDSLKKS